MRQDTPFGPVWIYPDVLPEKAAKHGARLDLVWPDLEGFSAMHTGTPGVNGAWLVRAPMVALKRAGLRTDSAAEYPVAEGTVWPPIHIPIPQEYAGELRYFAPAITAEQLYNQDTRKRAHDEENRRKQETRERLIREGKIERLATDTYSDTNHLTR